MLLHIFKQNSWRKFSLAYPDSYSQLVSSYKGFAFEFLNPNTKSSYHTVYFLGSSNGLVLCLRNKVHCVCNPITQQWVQLPPSPLPYAYDATLIGFVCDCLSIPTTSYKVVHITLVYLVSREFYIQVFSSDSGKWNSYDVRCPDGVTLTYPRGVSSRIHSDGIIIHCNVLYWIDVSNRIVAYNLENNESDFHRCRLIDLPDRGINPNHCLSQSNGSVFYARIKKRENILSVWVLQEDNFHLLHDKIDLHDLFAAVGIKLSGNLDGIRWSHVLIEILGFSPVDNNVVVLGYKNYIWAYNIGTRKYEELSHPSFLGDEHSASDIASLPLMLNPMPTILPPRSW